MLRTQTVLADWRVARKGYLLYAIDEPPILPFPDRDPRILTKQHLHPSIVLAHQGQPDLLAPSEA